MRLLLFAFMALFGSSTIYAQEPDPELAFVKEGKVWNCHKPTLGYYSYIIEGDTTISCHGKEYKKVWITDEHQFGDTERHYFGAVRQFGDYVYLIEKDTKREYMLYDFGIRKGGVMAFPFENTWLPEEEKDDVFYLLYAGTGEQVINGITRARVGFIPYCESRGFWADSWSWFSVLEGVGSGGDPFCMARNTPYDAGKYNLVSCYEGDTCIYTWDWDLNGISRAKADTQGEEKDKDGIYDLQGRRLPSVPAKGIYIKDGKVVVK